jgi:outer membrane protein
MKQSMILIAVLLIALPRLKAQQRYELTVKEAVDLAFKNLADVKNAQLDYQIQQAQNKEITGRALPQISGTAGVSHYLQLPGILFPDATATAVYSILKEEGVQNGSGQPITTVPQPVIRQLSFQQPWNAQAGITLQQLLFQPDVFVGLQARKTALNLSAAQIEQVKEAVKDSAYKKYYAILIAQKQLDFLNESVKRLEILHKEAKAMYENGFSEKLDLDKFEVQLTNLRTTRSLVQNGVDISYALLKYSLGISQKDTVVLKETLSTDKIKEGILDTEFKYEDRAEIRTLDFSRQMLALDVKRHKLGGIPTVAAIANYGTTGQGEKFITDKNTTWIRSSYVGLNINVPIFDGFQRKNRVQQSRLNLQKLDNTISQVKQGIDLEQTITKTSLANALLNLDAQQRNMELAEKVYNTTRIKLSEGVGSSTEVLLAENELQAAQNNYFNALYNAIISKISFQKSLGKLN